MNSSPAYLLLLVGISFCLLQPASSIHCYVCNGNADDLNCGNTIDSTPRNVMECINKLPPQYIVDAYNRAMNFRDNFNPNYNPNLQNQYGQNPFGQNQYGSNQYGPNQNQYGPNQYGSNQNQYGPFQNMLIASGCLKKVIPQMNRPDLIERDCFYGDLRNITVGCTDNPQIIRHSYRPSQCHVCVTDKCNNSTMILPSTLFTIFVAFLLSYFGKF